MNIEEGLRTPSKGQNIATTSSPSSGVVAKGRTKKPTKNAKITNFFTKVNSPLNKNNSNSNPDQGETDRSSNHADDLSKDASSNSMKMPDTCAIEVGQKKGLAAKDYVFIIPSSDDDTNVSTRGSTASRRRKPPSVHSNNSKSSEGLVLTVNNNELGIGPKKRSQRSRNAEKSESPNSYELLSRSSGRDSRSRDSLPEKRMKVENVTNQANGQKINRIQPTKIGGRTKMIDFQSVPSDLNMPRDQALQLIEKLFLVKMPDDFFLFWEFAKTINHRKPCSAFSHAYLEWNLVGPYDVLSGLITDFHGFSKDNLLKHCRFYYDPPEFQTVIVKKDSNITHYGYYRDDPNQADPIVVSNQVTKGGQLHEAGDNLFTLLKGELDSSISTLSISSQEGPALTFSSRTPKGKSSNESLANSNKQSQLEKAKAKQELTIIRDKLIDFCSTHENLCYESWSRTTSRRAQLSAKLLTTIGTVDSPIRSLASRHRHSFGLTDSKLRTILTRISDFKDDKKKCSSYQELSDIINKAITLANENAPHAIHAILELALDLFYQGDVFFHRDIETLLTKAYTHLKRETFLDILKSHLEDRKKSDKVSLLD